MLIIVEGVDGSGKSTLAQTLAKSLRGLLLKTEVVPPTPRDLDRFQAVTQLAEYYTRYVVCDRHHAISDLIYSPIVRAAPSPLDPDQCRIAVQNAFLIYCRPPDSVIRENVAISTQMKGVPGNIAKLIRSYDERFTSLSAWHFDYTEPTYDGLLAEIRS